VQPDARAWADRRVSMMAGVAVFMFALKGCTNPLLFVHGVDNV
jgi:hypothetical protein